MANIFFGIFSLSQLFVSYCLAFVLAPYNPNKPRRKYVVIHNSFLRKITIPPRNPYLKYVKVKDRNKLAVSSLILYLLQVAVLIAFIVLQCIEPIPCEPVLLPTGGRYRPSAFLATTYNQKIPYIATMLILLFQLVSAIIISLIDHKKSKEPPMSKTNFVLIIVFLLLLMVGIIYLSIHII